MTVSEFIDYLRSHEATAELAATLCILVSAKVARRAEHERDRRSAIRCLRAAR